MAARRLRVAAPPIPPPPSNTKGASSGLSAITTAAARSTATVNALEAEDDLVAGQLEAIAVNSDFLSLDLHFSPSRPAPIFEALALLGGLMPRREIYLLGLLVNPREKQFSVLVRMLLIPPA